MSFNALFFLYVLTVLLIPSRTEAQVTQYTAPAYEGIDINEKLGEVIPLDVKFALSTGDSITIGELVQQGKPVLLNPLYYECPMLCGLVVEGVFNAVDQVEWSPGEDYTVISFSIDPKETHEVAAKAKMKYLSQLEEYKAQDGWYFLTGTEEAIIEMTKSVGFNYTEIEQTGEYAHSAAIMFLSPDGMITRYLYGINFDEFDVRNALYEAADGKIGSTVSKVLMYCYQYDPSSDSYVPVAINIMKIGGFVTLLILGIFLSLLWVREKRKKQSLNFNQH